MKGLRQRRIITVLGVAVLCMALGVLGVGCGGGGSSEASSETSSEASTPASEGGSGQENSGEEATGSPIKIGVITDASSAGTSLGWPGLFTGAEALAKNLNMKGGVEGHPVEIKTCDTKLDPNEATKCAREMSSGVPIVFQFSAVADDQIVEVLQGENVPSVPLLTQTAGVLQSPNAFPITVGNALYASQGYAAAEAGCKKPVIVGPEVPVLDGVIEQMQAGLKFGHGPKAGVVKYAPTTTDYAAFVAEVTGGGYDCLIAPVGEPPALAFLPLFEQSGANIRLFSDDGTTITPATIKAAEPFMQSAIGASFFPPPNDPVWDEYKEIIAKYAEGNYPYTASVNFSEYAAFRIFTEQIAPKILEAGEEVDAATTMAALNEASDVEIEGILPAINFTKESELPGFPRAFNTELQFHGVKGDETVATNGEWHDMAGALKLLE
jgi:ABC-type branched-subunit amino acid transport system substrate-binding protein